MMCEERRLLGRISTECADLFQRSSSCVEGRNGQLALQHHSRHPSSDRKLVALTAVHNYFTQRPVGTTAAERFFGRRPDKLFDRIVEQVPLPGRPARKRPRLTKTALSPAASCMSGSGRNDDYGRKHRPLYSGLPPGGALGSQYQIS